MRWRWDSDDDDDDGGGDDDDAKWLAGERELACRERVARPKEEH
jgi:hypothetical protein